MSQSHNIDTTINAAIIADTLERVAEKVGDPKEFIFAELFEKHPEYEDMFVLDTDGGVRGAMLEACIECVLGVAEGSKQPRLLLEAARMAHDGYGLVDGDLDNMFIAMRDVFRSVLGGDWTPETGREWTRLLAELAEIT